MDDDGGKRTGAGRGGGDEFEGERPAVLDEGGGDEFDDKGMGASGHDRREGEAKGERAGAGDAAKAGRV